MQEKQSNTQKMRCTVDRRKVSARKSQRRPEPSPSASSFGCLTVTPKQTMQSTRRQWDEPFCFHFDCTDHTDDVDTPDCLHRHIHSHSTYTSTYYISPPVAILNSNFFFLLFLLDFVHWCVFLRMFLKPDYCGCSVFED